MADIERLADCFNLGFEPWLKCLYLAVLSLVSTRSFQYGATVAVSMAWLATTAVSRGSGLRPFRLVAETRGFPYSSASPSFVFEPNSGFLGP